MQPYHDGTAEAISFMAVPRHGTVHFAGTQLLEVGNAAQNHRELIGTTGSRINNLIELCPMNGCHIGHVWWNVEITHYYSLEHGHLYHYVVPQYNSHGNFLIGSEKMEPFSTAPSGCANYSYPVELYFYHGSIGYYSFYDELVGTYCIKDHIAYTHVAGVGTFDINGLALAEELNGDGYRWSLWYSLVGALFRGLVLRRCYISCKRYGDKCAQMDVSLRRKAATIYVHEKLRLAAHGATNYHQMALLYLLLEGLMSDLFLLAATDGAFDWVQHVSLGYISLEYSFCCLKSWRTLDGSGKAIVSLHSVMLFSYESSLIGELLGGVVQSYFLTSVNQSDLRRTNTVALAVSYYVWGLVGHGIIVLFLIGFIVFVRILRAVSYTRLKHGHTWDIFWASCCVDNVYATR